MMRQFAHILVWLALLASAVPTMAIAMPMSMHHQNAVSYNISSQKFNKDNLATNAAVNVNKHSLCKADQDSKHHKQCCETALGCIMHGCANGQTLFYANDVDLTLIKEAVIFSVQHEQTSKYVAYLLKRPPKV